MAEGSRREVSGLPVIRTQGIQEIQGREIQGIQGTGIQGSGIRGIQETRGERPTRGVDGHGPLDPVIVSPGIDSRTATTTVTVCAETPRPYWSLFEPLPVLTASTSTPITGSRVTVGKSTVDPTWPVSSTMGSPVASAADETLTPERPSREKTRKKRDRGSSSSSSTSVPARRRHRIRVQTYDGSTSFESFWAHFKNCVEYNGWKEPDQLAHLKAALTGDAAQVLWDTDPSSVGSVEALVTMLSNRFAGTRQADRFRMELRARKRKRDETLVDLHREIRRLMALAYPTLSKDSRETFACDFFIDALDEPDFALKVRERNPASLDEALRVAQQLEAWMTEARRQSRDIRKIRGAVTTSSASEVDPPDPLQQQLARLQGDVTACISGLRRLEITTTVNPGTGTVAVGQPAVSSQIEGRGRGNFGPGPPNRGRGGGQLYGRGPGTRGPESSVCCWECGGQGHIRSKCPSRKRYRGGGRPEGTKSEVEKTRGPSDPEPNRVRGSTAPTAAEKSTGSEISNRDPRYLHMMIDRRSFACLLDTGCDLTLISEGLLSLIHKVSVEPMSMKLEAANGTKIQVVGKVILPFKLGSRKIKTQAYVSPDVDEVMLLADWLSAHRCQWNFVNKTIAIDGGTPLALSARHVLRCRRILLEKDVSIPPRSQVHAVARTTFSRAQLG